MKSTPAIKTLFASTTLEATHASVKVDFLIHTLQMGLLVRTSMSVAVVFTTAKQSMPFAITTPEVLNVFVELDLRASEL